jgi:hypothetical protein
MRRDPNLIRGLLLKLEEQPSGLEFTPDEEAIAVEGYDAEQIEEHFIMLADGDLIKGSGRADSGGLFFLGLTWEGRDFLDTVRDPVVWEKTKRAADEAKAFSLDMIKDIGKGFIKTQIKKYTEVEVDL